MEYTLQQLFRRTDAAGRYAFSTAEQRYLMREDGQSLRKYMAAHALWYMEEFKHLTVVFRRVKSSIKQLEIVGHPIEGTPNYSISFNMARMVRLPGKAPAEELEELAAFFDSTKPFFEKHSDQRPFLDITNNRDKNRRTYGLLACRYVPRDCDLSERHEAFTQEAMSKIQASPVLSSWMHQVALDLNKLGPWSRAVLEPEHLMTGAENPVLRRLRLSA